MMFLLSQNFCNSVRFTTQLTSFKRMSVKNVGRHSFSRTVIKLFPNDFSSLAWLQVMCVVDPQRHPHHLLQFRVMPWALLFLSLRYVGHLSCSSCV